MSCLVSASTSGWLLGTGADFGGPSILAHLLFAFGLGAALYAAIERVVRWALEHARAESQAQPSAARMTKGRATAEDAAASASAAEQNGASAAGAADAGRAAPQATARSGQRAAGRSAESVAETIPATYPFAPPTGAVDPSRRLDALGRRTAAVLHDVNNVLTAISGHAELALRRLGPGDGARPELEGIGGAVERCARLTRQLLPRLSDEFVQTRPLELNTVIKDMSRMLARLLGNEIDLVIVPGASRSLLLADLAQIERLVLNLAVNARDAMPGGGVLRVLTENVERLPDPERSDPGGLGVALIVQDTGNGMDAATRARLFEPGFTTRPDGAGTGFGLSTVHEVVRLSSATIDCQSAPGRGTTFRVVFPLAHTSGAAAAGAAGAAGSQPVSAAPPRGNEAVLLVEDDPAVRELCRRFLGEAGYTVHVARDAAEALERTAEDSIRLLLADVSLPGGDGRGLAERLLLLCPEARVLYMSGQGGSNALPAGLADGTSDFLAKPFTGDELLHAVRRTLDRPTGVHGDRRVTVLVIDDDAEVRRIVHGLLEAAGFQVMTAPDGAQALALLEWRACDVVLCDIFMPNKEGIETCTEIRARFPTLRVIAMSGAAGSAGYLRAAEKLGAVASLHKPFTGQELVAVVQGAITGRADRARRQVR